MTIEQLAAWLGVPASALLLPAAGVLLGAGIERSMGRGRWRRAMVAKLARRERGEAA